MSIARLVLVALLLATPAVAAESPRAVVVTRADGRRARYAVEHKVGNGDWGNVYAGRDEATGESVAIKILHAHMRDGQAHGRPVLEYEDHVLSLLHRAGAGLPESLGVGATDDEARHPALVMELVRGEALGPHYHHVSHVRPVGKTVRILIKLARDIERMNLAGWAHYDVHPANVRIDRDQSWTARIVDVGHAGAFREGQRNADLESNGYLGLAHLGVSLLTGMPTNDPSALAAVPRVTTSDGAGTTLRSILARALAGGYAHARDFARALEPFQERTP